ncbi:3686_t:CDS:2, partial [Funneliformis geosporum]
PTGNTNTMCFNEEIIDAIDDVHTTEEWDSVGFEDEFNLCCMIIVPRLEGVLTRQPEGKIGIVKI